MAIFDRSKLRTLKTSWPAFAYRDETLTVNAYAEAGFWNPAHASMRPGTIIYAVGSDGVMQLRVTASTPNEVIVGAMPSAGNSWPLASTDIGVNVERNYNVADYEHDGVLVDTVANIARNADAVRMFVYRLAEHGHGTVPSVPEWPANPTANANWARVKTTIDRYIAAGMKVIYAFIPYPGDGSGSTDPISINRTVLTDYVAAGAAWFAANYSPDDVILEAWSETASGDQSSVNQMIADCYTAMRAAAPQFWLAFSGTNYGRIWESRDIVFPEGATRTIIDIHDYEVTNEGSATYYGRVGRMAAFANAGQKVMFGEIDMLDRFDPVTFQPLGYAIDDPRRITKLQEFQAALVAAGAPNVPLLLWSWNSNTSRTLNTPNSAEVVSDWHPELEAVFLGVPEPMAFTVQPSITGTADVGGVLSGSTGTATGVAPVTYARQWQRGFSDISGATSATYTVAEADRLSELRLKVTATDAVGRSIIAYSPQTATVPGDGDAPIAGLVLHLQGPSHVAHFRGSSVTNENGANAPTALPVELQSISGRDALYSELQRFIPALPIVYTEGFQANTGISHWAADAGLTAAGQASISAWIASAAANPTYKAVYAIFCNTQELQFTSPSVSVDSWDLRHVHVATEALAQFDAALPGGDREVWVVMPGNRWNGDQNSRDKMVRLLNRTGELPNDAYPAISGFFWASQRATRNVGDANNGGDGIHYPRGSTQRIGAEWAWTMLRRWGIAGVPAAPKPVAVWRSAPQEVRVRVQLGRGASGDLRVATGVADGTGGLNPGQWALRDISASTWRTATVGTPITTWQSAGYIDIPITFAVGVDAGDVLHYATEKFSYTFVGTLGSGVHEVGTGEPGLTTTWESLTASPRTIVRTMIPFAIPVSLTPPADPVIPEEGDALLLESGDYFLLENGDRLLLDNG